MTTQLRTLPTWAKKSKAPPKFSTKGGRLKYFGQFGGQLFMAGLFWQGPSPCPTAIKLRGDRVILFTTENADSCKVKKEIFLIG